MKTKTLLLLVALAAPEAALAGTGDSCPFGSVVFDTAADVPVLARWNCLTGWQSQFWNDLRMGSANWGLWGEGHACDLNWALGRTYNAMWLLHSSQTISTSPYGRLYNAYNSFRSIAYQLHTKCDAGLVARFTPGFWIFSDNKVEVTQVFAFSRSPSERASTLVHEMRHDAKGHNGDGNCPDRGSSCDTDWYYDGANTRQAQWLSDYIDDGFYRNPNLLLTAYGRTTAVLDGRFNVMPDLKKYRQVVNGVDVYTRGLVRRCYPNCPPPPPSCTSQGLCGLPGACRPCGEPPPGCDGLSANADYAEVAAEVQALAQAGTDLINCP